MYLEFFNLIKIRLIIVVDDNEFSFLISIVVCTCFREIHKAFFYAFKLF